MKHWQVKLVCDRISADARGRPRTGMTHLVPCLQSLPVSPMSGVGGHGSAPLGCQRSGESQARHFRALARENRQARAYECLEGGFLGGCQKGETTRRLPILVFLPVRQLHGRTCHAYRSVRWSSTSIWWLPSGLKLLSQSHIRLVLPFRAHFRGILQVADAPRISQKLQAGWSLTGTLREARGIEAFFWFGPLNLASAILLNTKRESVLARRSRGVLAGSLGNKICNWFPECVPSDSRGDSCRFSWKMLHLQAKSLRKGE